MELDSAVIDELFEKERNIPNFSLGVDLKKLRVKNDDGWEVSFTVDSHTRRKFLNGWDDISLTMQQEEYIETFESKRPFYMDPQIS